MLMFHFRVINAQAHVELISNNCSCWCVTQEWELLMLMQNSSVITAHTHAYWTEITPDAHAQLRSNNYSCLCATQE